MLEPSKLVTGAFTQIARTVKFFSPEETVVSSALPSKMTPPEAEASELDMDMIIQSFIKQQVRPNEGHMAYDQTYNGLSGSAAVPLGTPNTYASVMLPGHAN